MNKLLVCLVFTFVPLAALHAADDLKPLFDGKSLDGWKQHGGKAKYRVENGEIVGSSVPNTQNSVLCTEKELRRFAGRRFCTWTTNGRIRTG